MGWSDIAGAIGGAVKTAGGAIAKGAEWLGKNSDTIGNVLGGIGSLGGLGGLFKSGSTSSEAAAQQYQYNLALQKQAQEWNEYAAKNRWVWETESKEAAGINKLYGLGNAPSLSSGMNSVGMADAVGEENNRKARILEAFNLAREYTATKAQIAKQKQETLTEFYNTQLQALEVIRKEKENKYIDEEKRKQLDLASSQILQNIRNANYILEQTKGLKRKNKFYSDHPTLGEVATAGQELESASKVIDNTVGNITDFKKLLKPKPKAPKKIKGYDSKNIKYLK